MIGIIDGKTYRDTDGRVVTRTVVRGTTCSMAEQVIYNAAFDERLAACERVSGPDGGAVRTEVVRRAGERAVLDHREDRRTALPAELADRVKGMPRRTISEGDALEGCIIGRNLRGEAVYLVDVDDRESPCTYHAWGILP